MKKLNLKVIRSWNPCYDPSKYLEKNWSGTIFDILDNEKIPPSDRLWCALRTELVSEKLMRVFAVWCARQVQHLMTDQRSIDALDFMDEFNENCWLINDPDWREGWAAAWAAARAAAWAAAGDAAGDAAWAAARAAAGDAARAAAWAAAGDAAGDAAWAAARAAAGAAARAAAGAAAWAAARAAAGAAAGDAQIKKLKEMILMEEKTK